jgi:hypothetical protein
MGGQSCCPRAPLCMAVSPMSKNLGNHCWLARTGPWRSSGRCRGAGPGGGCVSERQKSLGALIKLTATHPPPPRPHPLARRLGFAASTRHLQRSSRHKAGWVCRQGWSPDRVQRRGEGPVKGVDDGFKFMRLATTKSTHPCHPPLPTQPHLCNQHCHRSNSVPTSFATIPVQCKWLGSTTTAAACGGRELSLIICPLSALKNGFGVLRFY